MMAVDYEHEDVLTLLSRQKTIQLDIADSEGYIKMIHSDIYARIMQFHVIICRYTALLRAAEKKDSEVAVALMKILLEAGADPNTATIRRKTGHKMKLILSFKGLYNSYFFGI